jgi:mycothiol S-conjugate amidase
LAPGRMAGGVEQTDTNSTDLDHIVVEVLDERRNSCPAHLRDPRHLVFLNMDRYRDQLQQVDQALDVLSEYVPTDVVGVVVGGEHAGQPQARLFDPPEQERYVISRVDEEHLAADAVAHHVNVVAHRRGEPVAHGKVFASEQLMEEDPLRHGPHRKGRAKEPARPRHRRANLSAVHPPTGLPSRAGQAPWRPPGVRRNDWRAPCSRGKTNAEQASPSPYLGGMTDELSLLCVHAHPDDEASKGSGTVARYHAEGVRCVLVCCTGGEEGDVLNPAMNRPDVIERLPEIRAQELERSAAIIGYDEVVMLGYRDSGMPGSEANEHPGSFAKASLEDATGRLVAVVRRTKPQVMAIYPAHQSLYPHPDHIRAHEIGLAAFQAAGDPDAYAWAGPAWQPQKLYYMLWSKRRMLALAQKFVELGMELPWGEERLEMMADAPQEDVTTEVDFGGWSHIRREALLAHQTQVDPNSPFWFGLPAEAAEELGHYDDYHLAHNFTASQPPEDDLFAGIRERATL